MELNVELLVGHSHTHKECIDAAGGHVRVKLLFNPLCDSVEWFFPSTDRKKKKKKEIIGVVI